MRRDMARLATRRGRARLHRLHEPRGHGRCADGARPSAGARASRGIPKAIDDTRGQLVIAHVERGDYRQATVLAEKLWAEGKTQPTRGADYVRALIGRGFWTGPWSRRRASCDARDDGEDPEAAGSDAERRGRPPTARRQVAASLTSLLGTPDGRPLKAWYALGVAARRPHARGRGAHATYRPAPAGVRGAAGRRTHRCA